MYASTHPWRSAALGLCGAAGLALLVAFGPATDRSASALTFASDAVVMPSATPLPAEPATTEPATDTAPAADTAPTVEELFAPREEDTAAEELPSAENGQPAEETLPTEEAAEPAATPEESPATPDAPVIGPPQPEGRSSSTSGGVLLVPSDIEPGTYQGTVPEDSSNCYWARLKGTSGETDDIIANDSLRPGERITVTISESDVAFEHSGCGTLSK